MIKLDGIFVTQIERIADQGVTDRHFFEAGDMLSKISQILEVEVVTGVETQTQLTCAVGGGTIGGYSTFGIGRIFPGVRFGVQFDPIGAGFRRAFDHCDDGIDEQRDPDTGILETADGLNEIVFVPDRIPAVVGRDLVERVRDKRHLRGAYIEHEVDEFLLLGIALDIEFGNNDLFNIMDILITDMALVGPWVNGYSVRAEPLRIYRGLDDVGIIAAPAIAERAEFVDVYGEFRHAPKITKRGGTRLGEGQKLGA